MPIELRAALHAWWRFAWRSSLAFIAIFFIPLTILGFAIAARSGAALLASGFLLILGLCMYFWVMARVMGRSVFSRPIPGAQFAVFRGGNQSLATPIPNIAAWGLLWGVTWRAYGLGVLSQVVAPMLRHAGTPPFAIWVIVTMLGMASQIAAFRLIILQTYGRTSVVVVRTGCANGSCRSTDCAPVPIDLPHGQDARIESARDDASAPRAERT